MLKRESRRQSLRKRIKYSFKSLKEYKYVNDYNNTTHKECAKYDSDNNYIYEKNLKLFNRTSKMLEKRNAIFGLPEGPKKPRTPSNVELFIIFKRRKEKTDNKLQTLAVIYLLKNNYQMIVDPDISIINKMKNHFEPYQAIEIAEKVSRNKRENFVKETLDYVNANKIYLQEHPEDSNVQQKIRFYNTQNVIIRKNSNSSIGNRDRSNSDTFVVEQRANEKREKIKNINSEPVNTNMVSINNPFLINHENNLSLRCSESLNANLEPRPSAPPQSLVKNRPSNYGFENTEVRNSEDKKSSETENERTYPPAYC